MALGNPYELDSPSGAGSTIPGVPSQGQPAQPAAQPDDMAAKFQKMQQVFGQGGGASAPQQPAQGGTQGGLASGFQNGLGDYSKFQQFQKMFGKPGAPSVPTDTMNGSPMEAFSPQGSPTAAPWDGAQSLLTSGIPYAGADAGLGGAGAMAGSAGMGDLLGAGAGAGGLEALLGGGAAAGGGAALAGLGGAAAAEGGGLALADLLPLLLLS